MEETLRGLKGGSNESSCMSESLSGGSEGTPSATKGTLGFREEVLRGLTGDRRGPEEGGMT